MLSEKLLSLLCAVHLAVLASGAVMARPASRHARRVGNHSNPLYSAGAHSAISISDDRLGGEDDLPTTDQVQNFNVLILSFLTVSGPQDRFKTYTQKSATERAAYRKTLNDQGCTLMISALGSTEAPTTQGVDPASLALNHTSFVKQYGLQGIDVDYEDMQAMDHKDGTAERWLIDYTTVLRRGLPAGQYLITHAPVAPWFNTQIYISGAYTTVQRSVGELIDWYNVQFYNQGDDAYTTCDSLLGSSMENNTDITDTSVFGIHNNANVPLSKIVIGKPAGDGRKYASNGFMDLTILQHCVATAGASEWTGGVMFWQLTADLDVQGSFENIRAALQVIANVPSLTSYSELGGDGDGLQPTNTTSLPLPTSTLASSLSIPWPSSSSALSFSFNYTMPTSTSAASPSPTHTSTTSPCYGLQAWNATKVYDGGIAVSSNGTWVVYDGNSWLNMWWTQGDAPGNSSHGEPWFKGPSCGFQKRKTTKAMVNRRVIKRIAKAHRARDLVNAGRYRYP